MIDKMSYNKRHNQPCPDKPIKFQQPHLCVPVTELKSKENPANEKTKHLQTNTANLTLKIETSSQDRDKPIDENVTCNTNYTHYKPINFRETSAITTTTTKRTTNNNNKHTNKNKKRPDRD